MHIPIEAVIFLCVIVFLVALLILFYLYLDKKLCFKSIGGLPCVERRAKGADGDISSDEDSDTEVMEKYKEARKMSQLEPSQLQPQAASTPTLGYQIESESSDTYMDTPDRFGLLTDSGQIRLSLNYQVKKSQIQVYIVQVQDTPTKERGGSDFVEVHGTLLPAKSQRFRTKSVDVFSGKFQETFSLKNIKAPEVRGLALRLRLYSAEPIKRQRLIGECLVNFGEVNLEGDAEWFILKPRQAIDVGDPDRLDGDEETVGGGHGGNLPELLVRLSYTPLTGRLAVGITKGINFKVIGSMRPPDSYVKLTLMSPADEEMSSGKTVIKRESPNPNFRESFVFQVPQFQLGDVTLMVSAYSKKAMGKKEMIGWFSMGRSSSSEEERLHWEEIRERKDEKISRWHILLEP